MKKILIIEDDPKVVASLKTSLQKSYDVELAEDGQSGYYAISEKKPLAVIMDVTIAQMDPLAIIGKIRAQKRFSTLPFFILVEAFPDDLADEVLQAGAVAVFSKSDTGYIDEVVRTLTDLPSPK